MRVHAAETRGLPGHHHRPGGHAVSRQLQRDMGDVGGHQTHSLPRIDQMGGDDDDRRPRRGLVRRPAGHRLDVELPALQRRHEGVPVGRPEIAGHFHTDGERRQRL
ncbi:hypothetical protein GCM10022382_22700 [Microbacterium invictum]